MFDVDWKTCSKQHEQPTYPLLPVLETRFWSVPFCRSWLFMMASCFCFRSMSLALTSSSTHRSDKSGSRLFLENGNHGSNIHMIINKFNSKMGGGKNPPPDSPRGVSSRTDFAFKLAPLATSSSTIWTCPIKSNTLDVKEEGLIPWCFGFFSFFVSWQHLHDPSRRQREEGSIRQCPSPPPGPCAPAAARPQTSSH